MSMLINFGMSQQIFLDEVFERKPALLRRAVACQSYTWDIFSQEFFSIHPASGGIQIYKDGLRNGADYMQGAQDADGIFYDYKVDEFIQLMQSGASLVISRFERISPFVAQLCRTIADFTRNMTVGNAYVAMGGNGTFGKHWDTHCVFALQLKGAKRWKLYKPTCELPLFFQTSIDKQKGMHAELALDTVLQEGDLLYIPRGWWHEVFPLEGNASMHIAAGVHTIKLHDYFKWLIMRKMHEHVEMRKSLQKDSPETQPDLPAALEIFSQAALARKNIESYMAECQRAGKGKIYMNFSTIFEKERSNETA